MISSKLTFKILPNLYMCIDITNILELYPYAKDHKWVQDQVNFHIDNACMIKILLGLIKVCHIYLKCCVAQASHAICIACVAPHYKITFFFVKLHSLVHMRAYPSIATHTIASIQDNSHFSYLRSGIGHWWGDSSIMHLFFSEKKLLPLVIKFFH